MSALLEVEALSKRYPVGKAPLVSGGLARLLGRTPRPQPRLHAVDAVDLVVGRGETVGLVGESGCGKSTLARLLARLIEPSAGSIRFDGTEIGGIPARRFGRMAERGQIQMVFQDPNDSLNPRFTAFAAIADPLRRLGKLKGAALSRRVEEVAALVGLPGELLGRFPHQLSGGQKARIGIARAVALEPRLLILDEPTAALDVSVQVVILHLLEALKRRLDLSYVFVSHDLNLVRLICDRVVVMYLGRIVEVGPAAALYDRPAHPYTRALLQAIPHFAPGETDRAAAARPRLRLAGEPRSPIDPDPATCRFYGRCPAGQARCAGEMPALAAIGPQHRAACHFPLAAPSPTGGFPS